MRTNTTQAVNNATYYKVKKDVTYKTTNRYGKETEKTGFAFVKWNGQEEEFISTSVGGHIGNLTLGEEKSVKSKNDGKTYTVQEVYLEIHSYDDKKELQRGIISMPFKAKMTRAIISKLVMCNQYSNVNIELGQFTTEDGVLKDFVTVWDGEPYRDSHSSVESLFIIKEEYRKSDKQVLLPPRIYLKKDGKQYVETENYEEATDGPNGKMLAPSYDEVINALYASTIESIKKQLTPLEPFVGPAKPAAQDAPEDEPAGVYYEELPDTDDAVAEMSVQMPF